MRGHDVDREAVPAHPDAQRAAAHARDRDRVAIGVEVVEVERGTAREISQILVLDDGEPGEKGDADAAAVRQRRDALVGIAPGERLLQVEHRLLAADLLQASTSGSMPVTTSPSSAILRSYRVVTAASASRAGRNKFSTFQVITVNRVAITGLLSLVIAD